MNKDIKDNTDKADGAKENSDQNLAPEQTPHKKRRIRSFVKRTGRMTKGQEISYENMMPTFGLNLEDGLIDVKKLFDNKTTAKLNVEIGFGMGDSLAMMAIAAPHENFIGIEVHTPGVGRLLNTVEQDGIQNIRVFENDAIDIFNKCIAEESIDRLQIYFPDPWHKNKHHKRRLVNNEFLDLVIPKLKPHALIHIATDWQPYSAHVIKVFKQRTDFINLSEQENGLVEKPAWRPETKFERRGHKLGHAVYDMLFEKV